LGIRFHKHFTATRFQSAFDERKEVLVMNIELRTVTCLRVLICLLLCSLTVVAQRDTSLRGQVATFEYLSMAAGLVRGYRSNALQNKACQPGQTGVNENRAPRIPIDQWPAGLGQ